MASMKPFGFVRDNFGGPLVFQHQPFDSLQVLLHSTQAVYSHGQVVELVERKRQASALSEREACAQLCRELIGNPYVRDQVVEAILARSTPPIRGTVTS